MVLGATTWNLAAPVVYIERPAGTVLVFLNCSILDRRSWRSWVMGEMTCQRRPEGSYQREVNKSHRKIRYCDKINCRNLVIE